jgi:hypothetical protein
MATGGENHGCMRGKSIEFRSGQKDGGINQHSLYGPTGRTIPPAIDQKEAESDFNRATNFAKLIW